MIVLKHCCIADSATELDRPGHSLVSAVTLELFVGLNQPIDLSLLRGHGSRLVAVSA